MAPMALGSVSEVSH